MRDDEGDASEVDKERRETVQRKRDACHEAEKAKNVPTRWEEEEKRKEGASSPSGVVQSDGSTEASTAPRWSSCRSTNEVVLLKESHIQPAQAYCELLNRLSTSAEERLERLRSRSAPLSVRREQLKEEVQELRHSAETAKRRLELIKGTATTEKWGELLKVTQELKYMVDCCTAELAAASRESRSLDIQIGKYKAKMNALGLKKDTKQQ